MEKVEVNFKYNSDKTRCTAFFIHNNKEYKSSCDRFDKIHCVSYERCSFDRLCVMINRVYPNTFELVFKKK